MRALQIETHMRALMLNTGQERCTGRFLGITSGYPSVPKSNELHIDIFWFFLIKLRYIQETPLKKLGDFPAVSNFNLLLLKLNWLICN